MSTVNLRKLSTSPSSPSSVRVTSGCEASRLMVRSLAKSEILVATLAGAALHALLRTRTGHPRRCPTRFLSPMSTPRLQHMAATTKAHCGGLRPTWHDPDSLALPFTYGSERHLRRFPPFNAPCTPNGRMPPHPRSSALVFFVRLLARL